MSESKLIAQPRSEFGKGASRRLRRAHQVPAVLYGHGTDPVHIALPGHETMLALKQANALLDIDLQGGKSSLALAKDIQRHPVRGHIEHVDLLIVRRGEKVTVEVPLHVTGEAAPDTLVQTELTTLSVEVDATKIPESIELDSEGAEVGTQFLAGQITLPDGATLVTDEDTIAILISDGRAVVEDETDEDGEDGDEAAEGETAEAPADEA